MPTTLSTSKISDMSKTDKTAVLMAETIIIMLGFALALFIGALIVYSGYFSFSFIRGAVVSAMLIMLVLFLWAVITLYRAEMRGKTVRKGRMAR